MKPRNRDRKFLEAIINASPAVRAEAEAIAAEIDGLNAKPDLAERCLHMVCRDSAALLEILERDVALQERSMSILLTDASRFDRARNVAMAHQWRDSKSYCAFSVAGADGNIARWDDIRKAIQGAVNEVGFGRRASIDVFEYVLDTTGDLVYHVAIYLESAAAMMREFKEDEWPEAVIHRKAKEIAIDFHPAQNSLYIAGKGIGGAKMFEKIALAFAQAGFDGEAVKVDRPVWNLRQFMGGEPAWFSPPERYASAIVTEIRTFSDSGSKGKLQVSTRDGTAVYARFDQLGLSSDVLTLETVFSVTISLISHAECAEAKPRKVQVTLTSPNARSYDGESSHDRTVLDEWLKRPEFCETP